MVAFLPCWLTCPKLYQQGFSFLLGLPQSQSDLQCLSGTGLEGHFCAFQCHLQNNPKQNWKSGI